ncbi:hypothetical protein RhiLY_02457 [Ceratobasidium sp. AG-Ba]|nr:hypothetical protein RhiLY_02457 [Ceratobasidium sp. AG-Ba]
MAPVRELAARFGEQRPSTTALCSNDDSEQAKSMTPSALPAKDSSDDNTTIVHNKPHASAQSRLSRQPRVSARANLELQPLTQSCPDPDATSSLDSDAAGSLPELVPPSRPARFLPNPRPHETSLSDSSTPAAGGISTPGSGLPASSTLGSTSTVLSPSRSDGLPAVNSDGITGPTAPGPSQVPDHTPLPVTKLFARNAAPLYLPELDELLEKRPRAEFTYPRRSKPGDPELFPPMNLLGGRRLKDLVYNAEPTPVWRDWNAIGSTLVNWALSAMGSSAISTFYSLSGLYNALQIFALILNTMGHASGRWRQLILGTIPNILALNLGGNLLESVAFLCALAVVSAALLFWFHRLTSRWKPNVAPEGLLHRDASYETHAVPFVSFVLTLLYLPLSTIAVHAITWSSDFWPVENPYLNTTQPNLVPLGPPSIFRDPLDFCWTTTMKKDEINYAPAAVIMGLLTVIFMTFWFPIRLSNAIKRSLPKVEPFDSLGQKRSEHELETEYQRLLERDKSPFTFLYNEYKRKWGSFKALYLAVKLTSLLIVALVSPDSCLSLSLAKNHVSRDTLAIVRQTILLAAMIGFLLLQTFAAPFIDPVSNASEWISRTNFVLTSLLGLLVTLNVPGQKFWNGWALYVVYIVTYGLTLYFTVVNWGWMHRVIKRITRRVDFCLDIFSPRLDVSPSSKHLQQRIWQESVTTLLLAAPQCRMPTSQKMVFVDGVENSSGELAPPYLLGFSGSPAERHVENLKILREVGRQAYQRPLRMSELDRRRTTEIRHKILRHLIGPDAFWCPTGIADAHSRAAAYFGNAWCIPFPLTVVIRYDHDGSLACITDLGDLENFIQQNEHGETQKRREIRITLRCLDNNRVKWPYTHSKPVGNRFRWTSGRCYEAHCTKDYYEAVLRLRRHGTLEWKNWSLASGFEVSLHYARHVILDGTVIGLNDAVDLTPQLARFFLLNKRLVDAKISEYLECLRTYRARAHREASSKAATLSYDFLDTVYSHPASPEVVARILVDEEQDVRVRELVVGYEDVFQAMYQRMEYVGKGKISAWWYIFWDDFWRRNKATIDALKIYQSDFDPQYTSSIAYRLLSRAALETFLKQRGLWSSRNKWYGNWCWLNTGMINKIYFHLNWLAFIGSSKQIHLHLGNHPSSVDLLFIDKQSRAVTPMPTADQGDDDASVTTSSGIKAGTSHSDSIMRTRRGYRWEALYRQPVANPSFVTKGVNALRDHRWHFWDDEIERKEAYYESWKGKFSQWFGVSPLGRLHWQTNGVGVDVVLDHRGNAQARYVRLVSQQVDLPPKTKADGFGIIRMTAY